MNGVRFIGLFGEESCQIVKEEFTLVTQETM